MRAFYAVLSYTLGYVALEVPRSRPPPPPKPGAPRIEEAFFASVGPDAYPLTTELAPIVATFASAEQFEYGLGLLLRGIDATSGGRSAPGGRPLPPGPSRQRS